MAQGNHKHVTVQTTDDFIKQCRDVFSVFDPDGAGTITQYKLSEVMKAYGWPAEHGELQVGVHSLQCIVYSYDHRTRSIVKLIRITFLCRK